MDGIEDGEITFDEFSSQYGHYRASGVIGDFQGSPFTTGGVYSPSIKTEILNKEPLEWYTVDDYPFHSR